MTRCLTNLCSTTSMDDTMSGVWIRQLTRRVDLLLQEVKIRHARRQCGPVEAISCGKAELRTLRSFLRSARYTVLKPSSPRRSLILYPGHTGTVMFSYRFLNRVVVVRDRIRIVGPSGLIKGGDNESSLFLERGKVEVEEREQPFPALVVLVMSVRVGGGIVGYRASGESGDSSLAEAIITVLEHVRHVE